MRIFLDTSALAKRYVQEPGSEELENLLLAGVTEVLISTLSLPEFGAALGRKVREKAVTKKSAEHALDEFERDWENVFNKVPLTEAIAKSAASMTLMYPLKGADAVHLASALTAGVVLLVASDQRLVNASEKLGLKAYNPLEGPFA